MIRYSMKQDACEVLGPFRRAVLWVQGCCFSCEGCIARGMHEGEGIPATPEQLAQWVLQLEGIEGITISGGEPMLQGEGLAEMISLIREKRDLGVICYTGFTWEALEEKRKEDAGIDGFLRAIDLLIDGPYIAALDEGKPYIGSVNQRLLPLTDRYRTEIETYYQQAKGRKVELHVDGNRISIVGVPNAKQAEAWRRLRERKDLRFGNVEMQD